MCQIFHCCTLARRLAASLIGGPRQPVATLALSFGSAVSPARPLIVIPGLRTNKAAQPGAKHHSHIRFTHSVQLQQL